MGCQVRVYRGLVVDVRIKTQVVQLAYLRLGLVFHQLHSQL